MPSVRGLGDIANLAYWVTGTEGSNPSLSATQFGMFSYIMEKRRNRRVGREYRVAAEAETAHSRVQRRFTTICLCCDRIRCHDERCGNR